MTTKLDMTKITSDFAVEVDFPWKESNPTQPRYQVVLHEYDANNVEFHVNTIADFGKHFNEAKLCANYFQGLHNTLGAIPKYERYILRLPV